MQGEIEPLLLLCLPLSIACLPISIALLLRPATGLRDLFHAEIATAGAVEDEQLADPTADPTVVEAELFSSRILLGDLKLLVSIVEPKEGPKLDGESLDGAIVETIVDTVVDAVTEGLPLLLLLLLLLHLEFCVL
jgi:hypothetical protein